MATNVTPIEKKVFKLVLAGDSQAGKTSLLASFLSDQSPANALPLPTKTILVHKQPVNDIL